ncbi:MAG: hypothetical protein OXF81_04930, partial [Cyanobacteria bacterium MAG COS3_bin_20]|nr:hypothetical protein [Cyanobacteria bacterium MAG COS3_bin_20]
MTSQKARGYRLWPFSWCGLSVRHPNTSQATGRHKKTCPKAGLQHQLGKRNQAVPQKVTSGNLAL